MPWLSNCNAIIQASYNGRLPLSGWVAYNGLHTLNSRLVSACKWEEQIDGYPLPVQGDIQKVQDVLAELMQKYAGHRGTPANEIMRDITLDFARGVMARLEEEENDEHENEGDFPEGEG